MFHRWIVSSDVAEMRAPSLTRNWSWSTAGPDVVKLEPWVNKTALSKSEASQAYRNDGHLIRRSRAGGRRGTKAT